jgi:SAM-dependent methyltransferase
MTAVFGPEYARAYDQLYRDKDYVEECGLIDRLFRAYGDGPIRSVLDLGCGTGSHAVHLAERGLEVVGVDRSDGMLESARKKASSQRTDGKVSFCQGDLRNFQVEQSFDAAIMMFAVLGYQLENRDVLAALRTARNHLRSGGLFVFDAWYGPAVLAQKPNERVKTIPTEKGQILRAASGELDVQRHQCKVSYRLWNLKGDRLLGQSEEVHIMRYFFPLELELFLENSGFSPVRIGAFPEFDKDPDERSWNVLGVARAV